MNPTGITTLQEYKIQRQYREQKRKQYLRQFEVLKQKLGLQASQSLPQKSFSPKQAPPKEIQPKLQSKNQDEQLFKENQKLKQTLMEIQSVERQKLTRFKEQMQKAKLVYFSKIKELRELELAQKNKVQTKITKMEQQIQNASAKNKQIAQFNQKTEEQCNKANTIMDKYSNQIKSQYDKKLQDFNTIFQTSNEKITALQNQYNQDQFVQQTLKNDQLIQSIKQNAQKADEQINKIVEDYQQLLKGKTQIVQQLQDNNKMKQEQIAKMGALEQKLKTVCEKLGEEKKIYMEENKRMAEQLIQIKDLLTKAMGGQI